MSAPPSGEQFEIGSGEQRAVIVEVGGGVREYEVGGRAVLDPYPLGAMCDGAHGAPLIPWPNRLADGRYSFDGVEHQLALNEPAKRNASHGLLRWRAWRALERRSDRVVMGVRLHPMPGYPFALDVSIAYALGDGGLSVRTTAVNVGELACPFGAGQHPYISAGEGLLDDCLLELPAHTRLLADEERQLPTGREALAGSAFDFRRARRLGGLQIDSGFTDLERDADRLARCALTRADGSIVELWADERYGFIQLYSADTLAPERRRRGLAVEPMTCAPNAFRSGDGLVRLEPGASLSCSWGVRLR